MPTMLRADGRILRLCRNGVLLALAFAFSLVEYLVPISLLLPLPGVKLGLANVVITILFFFGSPVDAAVVSVLRIGLSALLFGTPVSFFFSLLGGAFAYLVLWLCKPLYPRLFSFVGVSVLAATGHHLGQMLAAMMVFNSGVLLTYLPVLLPAGLVMGTVTGMVLNLCSTQLSKLFKRGFNF